METQGDGDTNKFRFVPFPRPTVNPNLLHEVTEARCGGQRWDRRKADNRNNSNFLRHLTFGSKEPEQAKLREP